MLAMDNTSLTRTLAIMVRRGWVTERRGQTGENDGYALPEPEKGSSAELFRYERRFNRTCAINWERKLGRAFWTLGTN
jgi:hypothetical protein